MAKNETSTALRDHMSCGRIMDRISNIALFHRIQASDGYREAAQYVVDDLRRDHVDCEIVSYPANKDTRFLDYSSFMEWNCTGGYLELAAPYEERLCDWSECRLSIYPNSCAAELGEGVELVYLSAKSEADGVDLTGKLVLTSKNWQSMSWAVERGALGIVTDYVFDMGGMGREPEDLLDDRIYASMPRNGEANGCGFIITPRQGKKLRQLCRRMEESWAADPTQARYPVVRGYVHSEFSEGTLENVIASIPGTTDEYVVLTAQRLRGGDGDHDGCGEADPNGKAAEAAPGNPDDSCAGVDGQLRFPGRIISGRKEAI